MYRIVCLLAVALAACGTPNNEDPNLGSTDGGGDVSIETDMGAPDASVAPDTSLDAAEPDMPPALCDGLSPAACMAEPGCTLDNGCRAVAGDEPYEYLPTRTWVGTAQASGDKNFPTGDTEAVLSLFRSNGRDVRGVLHLPELSVRQAVWGGVGPTGELGFYLGTPECTDGSCNDPFGAAYDAGGLVTADDLELTDITTTDLVDFQTVLSLNMEPSDGFRPANPIYTRTDALVARWLGDFNAIGPNGETISLYCELDIDRETRDGGYGLKAIDCSESDRSLDTSDAIRSGDAASIAWADGVGWFALGTADTDLMFVGRVGLEGPWEGLVVERGGVWSSGDPIDPGDVPIESIRGTFTFHPFDNSF